MEKWTKAILQQAAKEGGRMDRMVKASRAEQRDSNKNIVALPKYMLIRIKLNMDNPVVYECFNGEFAMETAVVAVKPDKLIKVSPTTTASEIKDTALEHMPMLEYNRMEIQCEAEDLPDKFTVQQIANKWQNFVEYKVLTLHAHFRNPVFMKLYKYFIDMGIRRELAKNQTNTIVTFLRHKNIRNTLGTAEARGKKGAEAIIDTIKDQNISDDNKNEMTKAIIDFYRDAQRSPLKKFNKYMTPFVKKPTYNVGTTKAEAKPTNDTVDAFQNKQAKNQMDPFQDNSNDTSTVKEKNIKEIKIELNPIQDNGVNTSIGNENKKQKAEDMGFTKEEFNDIQDTLEREIIARQLETIDIMTAFRARLLEHMSYLPPLPTNISQ